MLVLNSVDDFIMQEIHDGSFPLPNLADPAFISYKTVIDKGKVLAIGLVKVTTEGILITNQKEPLLLRAKASEKVIAALKKDVASRRLHECHVFVKNEKVQKFLRHLGFVDSQGGKPLVIHF